MTDKIKKYLYDIQDAINLIEDFTSDLQTFDQYLLDLKTQSAVERQLIIIGESINKIRKEDTSLDIHLDNQIVGFRNRLVHAYDSIDNAIVWAIIRRHLEVLKEEVSLLIENN